jgi:hypothetical protein
LLQIDKEVREDPLPQIDILGKRDGSTWKIGDELGVSQL